MEAIIKDGRGTGERLKVDADGRAQTLSVIETRIADISRNEAQAYTLSTGFISLTTTGSFNGLLYIKNTDSLGRNMFIEHIRFCGDGGAGGMDMNSAKCVVYRNPTTGTLISGATDAYKQNNNFGSANEFNGVAYVGVDGSTVTNGDWFTQFETHLPGHSIIDFNDSILLPKNSAIAFAVKPTVAGDVCMEVNVHFE